MEWTPFRAAEKRYKARGAPPDLADVLDVAAHPVVCPNGAEMETNLRLLAQSATDARPAFAVPRIPGLVVLPAFVPPLDQRRLVRWALRDHARHPNETNLDAHYLLPREGLWNAHLTPGAPLVATRASSSHTQPQPSGPRQLISNTPLDPTNFHAVAHSSKPAPAPSPTVSPASPSALIPKLRWANIGWSYHWGSKQYDFTRGRGRVDHEISGLCKQAVRRVDWDAVFEQADGEAWGGDHPTAWHESYEPDAGIVNYYQNKHTLMAHVDRSEVCATSPLVSISLGNSAVFLIGGRTRDIEPTAILLRSGDVVIMAGPACRRAYHGVPRILENTLPAHFALPVDDEDRCSWTPYQSYMRTTRININVRQVFPKGFVPDLDPVY